MAYQLILLPTVPAVTPARYRFDLTAIDVSDSAPRPRATPLAPPHTAEATPGAASVEAI
ncbi:MAG TPA: hypothetical protein VFB32_18215 [Rudaea sp.]|nr:hypothetical protein [Rudaea sp.]